MDAGNNKISDLEGVFTLEKLPELVELVLSGNPVCSAAKLVKRREEGEREVKGNKRKGVILTITSYPYCVWARLTQLQMLDGTPVRSRGEIGGMENDE